MEHMKMPNGPYHLIYLCYMFSYLVYSQCLPTFNENSLNIPFSNIITIFRQSNPQGVFTKFQCFFHDFSMTKALKSRTFYMPCGMKETYTGAMSSRWGHKLEDTKIWSDHINTSLYRNAGWKKGTPFHERMPFNFPDFLWIFYNLSQFPWLF